MFPTSVLPEPEVLEHQSTQQIGTSFHVLLRSHQTCPPCPLCGRCSNRIHSRYTRYVADLPVCGHKVSLELLVRKFFCDGVFCERRVFCERLPTVVERYGRRTIRLTEALTPVSMMVSAEVGRKITQPMGIRTSPDSLLRVVRQCPEAEDQGELTKVGVDDWAIRKGHSYGTIIVDLESGHPVELLPDRETTTVKSWLEQHPNLELITRDRATAYAEACTQGAPQAEQIADLWHLLKNLREALARYFVTQRKVIKDVHTATKSSAIEGDSTTAVLHDEAAIEPEPEQPVTPSNPVPNAKQQQRQERFEAVQALHRQGLSIRAIAQRLDVSRGTVHNYLHLDDLPESSRQRRQRKLDRYADHLKRRWYEGVRNAATLFEELKTLGYRGGYTEVKQFLHPWREGAATFIPPPPTARAVSWWVLTNVEALALDRQAFLEQLKSHDEKVAHTIELAQQGWQVLRQRQSSKLKDWLSRALCCTAPELRSFARGLKRDYDAVRAALEHAETNGLAEGHVNRLKTHKRMMYGRANFDLLRAKVLYRG